MANRRLVPYKDLFWYISFTTVSIVASSIFMSRGGNRRFCAMQVCAHVYDIFSRAE